MSRRNLIRALLVAALIVLLVVLLTRGGDDGGATVGEPQGVSAEQLSDFAEDADHPIYWLGKRGDAKYELTETSSGRVFIRYLVNGAPVGDPRPKYVTVGTYPSPDAVAVLRRVARESEDDGVELARTDDGAVLLVGPGSTGSAHLAYPGDDVEVEVFSPDPGEALRLASRGDVRQVP